MGARYSRSACDRETLTTRLESKPIARRRLDRARSIVVVGLADMVLGVELEPELGDEIELGLEIVDMLLLVVHELLEQVAAHVVLDRVAMRRGLLVERPRGHLRRQIAVEHLAHVLPDMQG